MVKIKTLWNWLLPSMRSAAWAPAAVFAAYLVASFGFNAYRLYSWLDSVTHFAAGAALSHFLADLFDNADAFIGPIPRLIRFVLVFCCVGTAAVFWEFYEFFADHVLGTKMQFGNTDTMSDLFFGLLGSAVYLAMCKLVRADT